MRQRRSRCPSCPFRPGVAKSEGADMFLDPELVACAEQPPEGMPCHEDDLYGVEGIECRGHADARRMLARRRATPPTPGA